MNSITKFARASGFHYLIMILPVEFEKAFFWEGLIVSDNATATARNILVSEQIYRFGYVTDIVELIACTILSLIFYILFKSLNRNLSLLALIFSILASAIITDIGNNYAILDNIMIKEL